MWQFQYLLTYNFSKELYTHEDLKITLLKVEDQNVDKNCIPFIYQEIFKPQEN